MSNAGIPCGMVREVGEATSLPHLDARGAKLPLNVPGLPVNQEVAIINAGFLMSEGGPTVDQPPPRLNEHEAEIRAWLANSRENGNESTSAQSDASAAVHASRPGDGG